MATLFNTKISDTYPGLIKTTDNAAISATLKQLTDGSGNNTGLYINNAGDFKVTAILEWGSLKDTGTGVTITQWVTAANGIANFNNDTTVPTSAAVKTYVDAVVTASDLDFLGDSNTGSPAVDLDSQNFSVLGTANEIVTSGANQTLTIGLPNSVTISGTFTGATFSGDLNGTINTATTAVTQSAGDNSTKVATTAYVDVLDAASDLDFSGDSGTGDVTLNSQVFAITGTTNQIITAASGQGLNLSLPTTIHRNLQGNVTGNVTGDLTGNVTATSVLASGVTATTQSSSDSSTKVATTAYVKGLNNASDLDFTTDSGSGAVVLNTETLSVLGTSNQINSAGSGQAITLSLPSTVHRNLLGNVTGDLTGNADTATKWQTARDLSLTGQAIGTISSVDGTLNVSGAVTLDNNSVTGKVLTGLPTPASATVLATDSILEGFGKLQSQINGLANGLQFQGAWNATTNSPVLTSGGGEATSGTTTSTTANKLVDSSASFSSTVTVGDKVINQVDRQTALVSNVDSDTILSLDADIMLTGEAYTIDNSPFISQGHYYVVSVGGPTSLNGINTWSVGDWVIAGATNVWEKLDHTDVEGTGTPGNIAKWSATGVIADSIIAESGAAITVTGSLSTTTNLNSGSNFAVATNKFTANATTGNVAFTGDLAINTDKFTVNATSGNTVVAGTGTFGGNVTLSSTAPLLYLTNTTSGTGKNWRLSSATNGKFFITQEGVVDAVTIDHTSGNANFAGTINSGAITSTGNIQLGGTTPTLNFFKTSAGDVLANIKVESGAGTGGKFTIQTKRNGNTAVDALVINDDQNSTFAGKVNAKLSNIAGLQNQFNIENATNTSVLASFGLNLSNDQLILGSDYAASFLLKTNGTPALTIDTSQNVGIGTDSPDNILHIRKGDTGYASQVGADTMLFLETTNVSNALQFTSANTGQQYIMFGDDDPNAGWISYNHSDNNLNFRVNASERMRIDSSGNLLIGIDTASATLGSFSQLEVSDSTKGGIIINTQTAGANNYGRLMFSINNNINGHEGLIRYNTSDYHMSLWTDGNERMRITSAGNVAMGNGSDTINSDAVLTLRTTGFAGLDFKSARAAGNNIGGSRFYDSNSDTVAVAQLLVETDGSYNFYNGTNGAEKRIKITSGGSLEVGTATVAAANAAADNIVIKGEGAAVGLTISNSLSSGTGTIFFGDVASSAAAGFRYNHNTGDMAVSFEDEIAFANNGGERMRITSAGQILMTKTGADPNLVITNNSAGGDFIKCISETGDNVFKLDSGGTGGEAVLDMFSDGVLKNSINANGNTFFNNIGNVGIGTDSPRVQTEIYGAGQVTSNINDSGNTGATLSLSSNQNLLNAGGCLLFGALNDSGNTKPQASIKSLLQNGVSQGTGDLAFSTRGATTATTLTERMRITSAGDIQFPTNSAKIQLRSSGSADYTSINRDSSNNLVVRNTAGSSIFSLENGGNLVIGGTLTQGSDINLKENIKPLQSQLDIVNKLNPVSYNRIGKKENEIGFIAQEVEKLIPDLVSENPDGLKSLAYANMTSILVKAIQELTAKVEKLEQECKCK